MSRKCREFERMEKAVVPTYLVERKIRGNYKGFDCIAGGLCISKWPKHASRPFIPSSLMSPMFQDVIFGNRKPSQGAGLYKQSESLFYWFDKAIKSRVASNDRGNTCDIPWLKMTKLSAPKFHSVGVVFATKRWLLYFLEKVFRVLLVGVSEICAPFVTIVLLRTVVGVSRRIRWRSFLITHQTPWIQKSNPITFQTPMIRYIVDEAKQLLCQLDVISVLSQKINLDSQWLFAPRHFCWNRLLTPYWHCKNVKVSSH